MELKWLLALFSVCSVPTLSTFTNPRRAIDGINGSPVNGAGRGCAHAPSGSFFHGKEARQRSLPPLLSDSVWEGTVLVHREAARTRTGVERRFEFFNLPPPETDLRPPRSLSSHLLILCCSSHWLICGPAARSKTAKMSGYQGKKNIPRITVSFGASLQTLHRLSPRPLRPPWPGPDAGGGGGHAPRPPLRDLIEQLFSSFIMFLVFFCFGCCCFFVSFFLFRTEPAYR